MNNDSAPLEEIVLRSLNGRSPISILEAGCGSISHFRHPAGSRIVGVDISQEQLDKNTYLDQKILGSLEDDILPRESFDVIICWDVLEHLSRPDLALAGFAKAVAPGGLIVLASPNVLTLRGILTKMAPHTLKVLYYRHVVGHEEAGLPGTYPFPAYHRFSMSPPAIVEFARRSNLELILLRYHSWHHPEYDYPLFRSLWKAANGMVNFVTAGRIGTDDRQGFQIVLRKPRGEGRAA